MSYLNFSVSLGDAFRKQGELYSHIGVKRIAVIRKRIGIGIFMIHIRFLLTGTEYFKMVFLFVLTESEYFILVFLLKENEFNILTELFV